jgi:hypothetical protein
MKQVLTLFSILVVALSGSHTFSQTTYSFEDFVGSWTGTYTHQGQFGNTITDPITMVIEPDGYYTETTGHFMPTIYPNTQESEYDAETNRYHWWYLKTVYAGQYFYQHFYYEVVYFNNDTLEMHYNFWDDPEPHPEVGTLLLTRDTFTGIDDEPSITFNPDRQLVRVTDITGREVHRDTRGAVLIYQYDDGTTEKRYIY